MNHKISVASCLNFTLLLQKQLRRTEHGFINFLCTNQCPCLASKPRSLCFENIGGWVKVVGEKEKEVGTGLGGPAGPVSRWKPSGEVDFTSRPYKLTIWERAREGRSEGGREGKNTLGAGKSLWEKIYSDKEKQRAPQRKERVRKEEVWLNLSFLSIHPFILCVLPSWKGSPYSIAMPPSERRAAFLKIPLDSSLASSLCPSLLCVQQWSFL